MTESKITSNRIRLFDEAIRQYNDAIALNPKSPANYVLRGIAYSYQKKYDLEIADYNQALELKPDYADAYKYLGMTFYNKKGYQQAIYLFTKAIESSPEYAVVFDLRALTYDQIGDKVRAAADRAKYRELVGKP